MNTKYDPKQLTIAQITLPSPFRHSFDYLLPKDIDPNTLKIGIRVKVPFGHRYIIGILLGITDNSEIPFEKLKPIKSVIDTESIIPSSILKLCEWASDYYHYPLGEVLFNALPAQLRQGKPIKIKK